MPVKGLRERLSDGDSIIVAEGYVMELERRGYLSGGSFVPEVVLDHPEVVRALHEEFVHAGSDVVEAFTYYGHREKLRDIGRELDLEQLNINALAIARDVADRTNTLMAGNICNTISYYARQDDSVTEQIFKEQLEWAVEGGADFIIAETFTHYGEAKLALECIKKYGKGLPAVVTMSYRPDKGATADGFDIMDSLVKLEQAGADVVGLNCATGPVTMLPLIERATQICKGPVAALPIPYRTNDVNPTQYTLLDPDGELAFFPEIHIHVSTRKEITTFARRCREIGVQYIGLCCGNASNYVRILAEEYGRKPPASRYSLSLDKHIVLGDDWKRKEEHTSKSE